MIERRGSGGPYIPSAEQDSGDFLRKERPIGGGVHRTFPLGYVGQIHRNGRHDPCAPAILMTYKCGSRDSLPRRQIWQIWKVRPRLEHFAAHITEYICIRGSYYYEYVPICYKERHHGRS
jgi:hypothetical protein